MGTVFSIEVRSPGVEPEDVEAAISWLHWVDETFSTYKQSSQISRLGRGDLALAECDPEVQTVLDRCEEVGLETDGYFSARAAGVLDPSGYVKGWAIQRVSDLLRDRGSVNHCVNGGGDVQCAGAADSGRPWQIGIADPFRPGQIMSAVCGRDFAVATSGSAERGAHIVDPHDGRSPDALASLTVIGARLADVDAYATAAYAMGARAAQWLTGLDGYRSVIVYADGHRWASGPSSELMLSAQ
jgi:thiamine biosynthesis lipoprotein